MTVDEYIDAAPEPQQSTLRQLRAALAALLPDAEEGLSYGVPAFKVDGTPVAGYAYFKGHCGFYPHSEAVLSQVDPKLLAGYKTARGTLRFPIDAPLPEELVERLVAIRLRELEG